jgi:hypothetical protein
MLYLPLDALQTVPARLGDSPRNLLSDNLYAVRCVNTNPHLVTVDAEDGDFDIVTNQQHLTYTPSQY